ncbi:MAG: hypothetical protein HUU55_16580 [Myxococcales bacterium]|nr:hypothetical protein [Myxococcales bacterium]
MVRARAQARGDPGVCNAPQTGRMVDTFRYSLVSDWVIEQHQLGCNLRRPKIRLWLRRNLQAAARKGPEAPARTLAAYRGMWALGSRGSLVTW